MNSEDRLLGLEQSLKLHRRLFTLACAIAFIALTVGFMRPLAVPDPEAFKVTTANAASTPVNRIQVSGNEDTASIGLLNSKVGIGTSTPNGALDVAGDVATRAVSPTQLSANQNDYNPGTGAFFRVSSSIDVSITGFANGFDGRVLFLANVGSNIISLLYENASSLAANRISTPTGGGYVLYPRDVVRLNYDSTTARWRIGNGTFVTVFEDGGSLTLSDIYQLNFVDVNVESSGVGTRKADIYLDMPHFCEGRLTLTSGSPVTTSDVTAATTVYFTPYKGNRVSLYDGTRWKAWRFSQLSIAVPATTNTNYDVFIYQNAGFLNLETVAWTNNTTRATALTPQDGVYVKSGATTRRYLGTFRTTGTTGQTEDSKSKRFVWNYYNRVQRRMFKAETTDSWTYTTTTWRAANGSTANRVELVVGVTEDLVSASTQVAVNNSNGATQTKTVASGIGVDSTSVNSADTFSTTLSGTGGANNMAGFAMSFYRGFPGIGYHYLQWLEISQELGTTTWYGDGGITYQQSGLVAEILN